MACTANKNEEASQHGKETWTESSIVVSRSLPGREAIRQKVVISLSSRSTEDVRDYSETRETVAGILRSGLDFGLAWRLSDMYALLSILLLGLVFAGRLVCDELLLDLVRVESAGLLAVGLVDVVLGSRGLDAEEVVERDALAFGGLDFVTQAEDLLVCR